MKILMTLLCLMPVSAWSTEYDLKAYTHYHAQREQREEEQRQKCEASYAIVRQYWIAAVADFGRRHGGATDLDRNGQFKAGASNELDCKLQVDRRSMIVCYTSAQLPPVIEVIEKPFPTVNYECAVENPKSGAVTRKRR